MTPRSIAPVLTSGAPARSTSTPPLPNRAATVRADNWVVLALAPEPRSPRGSCRSPAALLPQVAVAGRTEGILEFHTKCELAVALLREQARIIKGKHLAVFDGGYALESVVRPLVLPEGGGPRIEFLTACGAMPAVRLAPAPERSEGKPGPKPSGVSGWSHPAGRHVEREVAGRNRLRLRPAAGDRWKEIICLWRVWAGRCQSRRLLPTSRATSSGSPGDLGGGVDGAADGGVVPGGSGRRTGSAT